MTYADEAKETMEALFPMASEHRMNESFPLATEMLQDYQEKDNELQQQVSKDTNNT